MLAADCTVHLLYSAAAQTVARQEMDLELPSRPTETEALLRERFKQHPGRLAVHGREAWFAPMASGSNPPDAMVVCHPNPESDHFQDLPVLIIEVLSESTRRVDLGEKRDAYLAIPSLQVLMFVDSDTAGVTLHRRKTDGGFAIEHYAGMDAVIELPEIGAALAMAEIYARVEPAA